MLGNDAHRCRRSIQSFLTDTDGTATIEFVILFPLFTTLLLLTVDASMLFLRHTALMNVSRDTARIVSRHAMTVDEAKAYAEAFASTPNSPATAEVIVDAEQVIVRISTDSAASSPFHIIPIAVGDKLVARTIISLEPV
jgi:Flp pilus assembly protein TadG